MVQSLGSGTDDFLHFLHFFNTCKSLSPVPLPQTSQNTRYSHTHMISSAYYTLTTTMPDQLIPANDTPFHGIKASQRAVKLTSKQDVISARNQSKLPLLRLPGELRNRIYENALSEPEGLHYQFAKNQVPRLFSELEASPKAKRYSLEANQLKYVCRQLWHESKGYGLSSTL
jgi:hypothetical protein